MQRPPQVAKSPAPAGTGLLVKASEAAARGERNARALRASLRAQARGWARLGAGLVEHRDVGGLGEDLA